MSLIPVFEMGVWNAWIFMIWLLIQNYGIRFFSKEIYQKAGGSSEVEFNQAQKITGYTSITLWLLTTIYSVFLPFKLGTIWFYTGLVIFFLGFIINIVVTVNFVATPIEEPVIKGIYRYSRHPMYWAMLLIYLSVGIASASWIFLLVSIVWLILIQLSVGDEERYCLEKYGDTYRKYMDRTSRWIGIPKS
ncbi:methyltransferase family protein [Chloroflexota bacterium]